MKGEEDKVMRKVAGYAAVGLGWAVACGSTAAQAQQAGSVYAFGDSLIDNGNIPKYLGGLDIPGPPYYKNHFSNGPVFVEYLPALVGQGFMPGNDFGVGGAFAGDGNLAGIPQLPGTAQEIDAAAASGLRFNSTDTVVLWAGSNNYFSIIGGLPLSATIDEPVIQASIHQVSGFIVDDASRLIGLGARRLVVLNVPDLGSTPSQIAAGQAVISTAVSQENNALLVPGLRTVQAQTGANIYLINAQLGIEEILANPARYGISNTTQECILTPACVNGTRAQQNTFLFWDDVHPTTGVHDYLAHVIANQLEAGTTIGSEAELMLLQAQEFSESMAQRLDAQRAADPGSPAFNVYVQGHYASGRRDAPASSSTGIGGFGYESGTVVAGADYRVLPNLIVGAAFGYGQPSANYDDGAGKLGFNAYQGGGYASLFGPDYFVDLSGAYSHFDSTSGERPAVLQGDELHFGPKGHAASANLGGGYVLRDASLSWGPIGSLTYTNAIVDAYTESGEPLLTQSVARQDVDSLIGRAGFQATVDGALAGIHVRPHASIQAEREFLDTRRVVETSFVSAGLPVADTLPGYTSTYGRIDFGGAADVATAVTALVDFQATFGRGNGEDRSVILKLDAHF